MERVIFISVARVLIVDDNDFNLNVLKDLLKEYTVITARDGRSALRLVMAEKPDLVLLDVIMLGVDGTSVLSILKNAEETRHIPVAVVTALSDATQRDKLFEKGADNFITKPFSPVELQARVKTLLRVKDLHDEIQSVTDAFISMTLKIYSSSRYFEHHSSKTAAYAEQIARKRIPSPRDRKRIKLAALLLDVGRLEIKDDILLMPEEFGYDSEWLVLLLH